MKGCDVSIKGSEVALYAIATANPPLYVTQKEAYEAYARLFSLTPDEDSLYRKLLLDGPVIGRYVGMKSTDEAALLDPDTLHERFGAYARLIGEQAARKAIEKAGLTPAEMGGLVVNTCTGYLCPGLSSYLAESLGMKTDIRALDLGGMGCGAALPNLDCTAGLLAHASARPMLSIAVEICTATLFMGPDPALVVSNAIFGDGASAAILAPGGFCGKRPPVATLKGFSPVLHPEYREELRYRQENGRLRNHLTRRVPVIGARLAEEALIPLLHRHQLDVASIRWWAVHGGGTAVLDEVGKRLGLEREALSYSRDVFRHYGNMSSPTVMFALNSILATGRPAAGDLGILLAFGAGFSAYAMLVEFTGASA